MEYPLLGYEVVHLNTSILSAESARLQIYPVFDADEVHQEQSAPIPIEHKS